MRIAVFSDVHGNLAALEAAWTDIRGQGADTAVFAGDLCAMGPRPAACVQFIREERMPAICGNTDEWLFGRQEAPEPRQAMAAWTREQLSEAERAWLGTLPFAIRYQPGNDPGDALHIVHANPRDVNQIIFPPEDEQLTRYGRVRQSDAALEPLLVGVEAAVLVFGHLHIPSKRNRGQLLLANISSVSIPGDGDPRAKYGIFTWQNGRWEMELRRVAYDVAPEIAAFRQTQPPGWEKIVAVIEADGFLGQNV